MDMPKSCEECKAICSRFNGNETVYYCGLTDLFIANYAEDLCEPRDVNCPIKCDIEDIKTAIIDAPCCECEVMDGETFTCMCMTKHDVLALIDKHTAGK